MPLKTKGRTPAERDALMREAREALARRHRDIGGPGEAPAVAAREAGPRHPLLNTWAS
ncbi:MAG TPA: hypothetical protein VE153_17855 [Myxococcus sp.]|nr:hypothetical protein [Myxococcus sp.]